MPCPSLRFGVSAFLGSLTACLLIAGAAGPPASAGETREDAYRTLVERSCTERDVALGALSRWSPQVLEAVGQRLHECEECRTTRGAPLPSEPSPSLDARCGCAPPPWAAAAAFHTLYAFTSATGQRSQFHISFAARLQARALDSAFRRQWLLAAGLGSLFRVDLEKARSFFRQGLEGFEGDPDLLVAVGASYEVEAWRLGLALGGRVPDHSSRGSRLQRLQRAERSRLRASAAEQYEEALAGNPEHPEAHLRLGRVALLLGRTDQGLTSLRWVVEHAGERDLVYLAHLFMGRVHERSGQLDAALASYRAALETDPGGQAASIATSHALHLAGDTVGVTAVLERGLGARRRARAHDPWAGYPEGRPDALVERLTRLHEEACR